MAVCQTAFAGFLTLARISLPYNLPRAALSAAMVSIFTVAVVCFRDLFSLAAFTVPMAAALPPLLLAAAAIFLGMHRALASPLAARLGEKLRALGSRLDRRKS